MQGNRGEQQLSEGSLRHQHTNKGLQVHGGSVCFDTCHSVLSTFFIVCMLPDADVRLHLVSYYGS